MARLETPFCFVAMPFGSGDEYNGKKRESDFILSDIIKPAIEEALAEYRKSGVTNTTYKLDVIRELEDSKPGDITDSIIVRLANAHLVIVDLTGRNSNVFLELGVRFALKRNGTILLTQQPDTIPFNIKTYRVVPYDPHFDGPRKAVSDLKKAVLRSLEILDDPDYNETDSVVYHALRDLELSRPARTETALARPVPWDVYWSRIRAICDKLDNLQIDAVYKPHVLVGISNGGLLLADSVVRIVYKHEVPLVCLWANRSLDNFFENEVNDRIITPAFFQAIVESNKIGQGKLNILVMDDIVGSQRTFNQLMVYFRTKLGDIFNQLDINFVFIYTNREEPRRLLKAYLLHNRPDLARREMSPLEEVTQRTELPYRKNIQYGGLTDEVDGP